MVTETHATRNFDALRIALVESMEDAQYIVALHHPNHPPERATAVLGLWRTAGAILAGQFDPLAVRAALATYETVSEDMEATGPARADEPDKRTALDSLEALATALAPFDTGRRTNNETAEKAIRAAFRAMANGGDNPDALILAVVALSQTTDNAETLRDELRNAPGNIREQFAHYVHSGLWSGHE